MINRFLSRILTRMKRVTCKHPYPRCEGFNELISFWHCMACGKHFSKMGFADKAKLDDLENAFHEGADAFLSRVNGWGPSLFDNPFIADSKLFHAWRRGFQLEARRHNDFK